MSRSIAGEVTRFPLMAMPEGRADYWRRIGYSEVGSFPPDSRLVGNGLAFPAELGDDFGKR